MGESLIDVARRYWVAEESRDIERILSHFHPEATWRGPGELAFAGHREIAQYYEVSVRQYPELAVEIIDWHGTSDEGAVHWRAIFKDQAGVPAGLEGVNIMSVESGLIRSLHAFFDPAQLTRQLPARNADDDSARGGRGMSRLAGSRPAVLVVDGRYLDYGLESDAVRAAGGELVVSGRHPVSEQEVLDLPGLSSASLILVELAPITRAVLAAAVNCVAVIRYGTGFDNVDVEAATELGIAVESVPGYAAESVSEHTLLLMLSAARHLLPHVDRVRHGEWRSGEIEFRPAGLDGAVLGIVGLGAIGRAIASRASAFGMKVLATDPYVDPASMDRSFELVALDRLLPESDYISLHLPLTKETRGMIDTQWLSRGKPGMVLINTARGGLVNEADLLRALDAGTISYAALDVSVDEPLPPDHAFRQHPHILFTPHIAFWSDQAEAKLRTSVAEIAVRYLKEAVPT